MNLDQKTQLATLLRDMLVSLTPYIESLVRTALPWWAKVIAPQIGTLWKARLIPLIEGALEKSLGVVIPDLEADGTQSQGFARFTLAKQQLLPPEDVVALSNACARATAVHRPGL